jgi:RNA polymerase sigma factor (sigma-70 family)
MDELTLAREAERGDSGCAAELRSRILRCAVSVARKMRWNDILETGQLEEDVPGEVMLRLIGRIRNGFCGEPVQFRTYLYRVVTSVAADLVRGNLDRRREISFDATFENAEGHTTTLRDFVESVAGLGAASGAPADPVDASLESERRQRLMEAVGGLDDWCRMLMNEAVVEQRPHAEIALESGVGVAMLDVSIKRCTEKLYRNLLMAYASGEGRARREEVATVALRLPAELRAVFVPWWNNNTSVRQIAAAAGLSTDRARSLLARAKATMWHLMQEP